MNALNERAVSGAAVHPLLTPQLPDAGGAANASN